MHWNESPAIGNPCSPSTSTGVDGTASLTICPFSSNIARTLPYTAPAMKLSPTRSVPFCTSTVATLPRPLSILASSTVPIAGKLGSALRFCRSATNKIISSRSSRFLPVLADTSTVTVSPPQSSACRPCSANSRLTRSGLTPGLSTLLMATTNGTLAALVCEIDSIV